MQFGIIGSGEVALVIARKLLANGHQVMLGSRRGSAALEDIAAPLGTGAAIASVSDAAAAKIVFLAVHWSAVESALSGLPAWKGRILVDATNPFVKGDPGYAQADLGGRGSSTIVAQHARGARVVKAFNSILMSNLAKPPLEGGGRRVLFVSGDDAAAKAEVGALIEGFGYAAIDLGSLEEGGRLQQGGARSPARTW